MDSRSRSGSEQGQLGADAAGGAGGTTRRFSAADGLGTGLQAWGASRLGVRGAGGAGSMYFILATGSKFTFSPQLSLFGQTSSYFRHKRYFEL